MSKIILIALIISAISCQNFLEKPSGDQIARMVEQFLNGLQLFKELPHEKECIQPDDAIIADVETIVEIIQHINKDNMIESLGKIVSSASDIYTKGKTVLPECLAWKDSVAAQFKKIGQYVSDKDYLTKLATHLLLNLQHIKDDVTNGTNAWNNGDYATAGKSFGDVVHFTFFWDFK
jgi:hypothetical protein